MPTFSFFVVDPAGDAFGYGYTSPNHDITSVAGVGDATTFCLTVSFAGPVSPADATGVYQVVGFIDFDTDQDPTTGVATSQNSFCPTRNTSMGVDTTLHMFGVSGGLVQIGAGYVPVVFAAQSFTAIIPLPEIGGDGAFNVGMVLGSINQPTDCAPGNGGCIEAPAGTICVPPPAATTDLLLLNADIVNAVTGGVFDLNIADGDAPNPVDSVSADCTGAAGFVCGVKEFEQLAGNGNGVLTSAEVAASGVDIDDNQLRAGTGLLVALVFVPNDLPVNITLSSGSFVQSQNAVLVCNQAPPSPAPGLAAPMGDNDCDNNVGTVGDGVVAAAISGAGATVGARSITAAQGPTSQTADFTVVGGPNSIELIADETTVVSPGTTVCALTAAESAADIAHLHATVLDSGGTSLTGVTVSFSSDQVTRVKVASPSVLSADNGTDNEVFNVACGVTARGDARITASFTLGAITVSKTVTITAVGVPAIVDLKADPAEIACDGTASSTVTATVTDSTGANVADGTAVTFSVVALGTADPINATTEAGVATSKITPLSGVQGVTVIVTAGSAHSSLLISCSLPVPCSGNDDFEDGSADSNQIPCWTVVDQLASFGSWCTQAGAIPPQGVCSGSSVAVAAPPQGSKAAMTNQNGPGSHVLYRCGTLASGAISFELYLNNEAGGFLSPDTLVFNFGANQQFRADLVTAASVSVDPFSVAAGDVLMSLYRTQPGDALVSGYTLVSRDASAFVGEQACLRFAEVDNQLFFHAGIDDVQIDLRGPATPPPPPTPTATATPPPTATATPPAAVAPPVVVAPPAPTRTATSVPATATAVRPAATPASAVLPAAIRAPDTGFGPPGGDENNYFAITLVLVACGGMIAAVAYRRRRG